MAKRSEKEETLYQEARSIRNCYRKTGKLDTQGMAWFKKTPARWAWLNVEGRGDATEEAIQKMNKVFDWMDAHEGRKPYHRAEDPIEKDLGMKLLVRRQYKALNKKGWLIYGLQIMALAKKRCYPRIFDNELAGLSLEERKKRWADMQRARRAARTTDQIKADKEQQKRYDKARKQ